MSQEEHLKFHNNMVIKQTLRPQPVPDAAPGFQQIGGFGRHLGAKAADVDVHGSLAALEVHAPDHVQQAVAGEELAPMQGQKAQQVVFAGRPREDAAPRIAGAAGGEVEDDAGQRQRVAGLDVPLAEAEQGASGQTGWNSASSANRFLFSRTEKAASPGGATVRCGERTKGA